jgi:predicted 2-oxoglutarate/Fe(II)-dependent dioxygenase YbiX/peroxiredoxin
MSRYRQLLPGDPAPTFRQRSTSNDAYHFHAAAGRYLVLCFHGSAGDAQGLAMLDVIGQARDLFDDHHLSFFAVSLDAEDRDAKRVEESQPGIRAFWDFDGLVSRLYGAAPDDGTPELSTLRRQWVIIDPNLRVRAVIPAPPGASEVAHVVDALRALPPVPLYSGVPVHAPIIVLPRVFEPEFCAELIARYEAHGGEESGFMREIDGKTTLVLDHQHKRRSDFTIDDEDTRNRLRQRILRRVVPEIGKVHQFKTTRMERYLVARYDSTTGDHFQPHRDNTTKGTAHRRFAVSVLLNDDYEGGDLGFPEYGPQRYRAPTGAAIVFSCSLLHEVAPVTRGRRYVFVPFLYDNSAAAIREANNAHLAEGVGEYRRD